MSYLCSICGFAVCLLHVATPARCTATPLIKLVRCSSQAAARESTAASSSYDISQLLRRGSVSTGATASRALVPHCASREVQCGGRSKLAPWESSTTDAHSMLPLLLHLLPDHCQKANAHQETAQCAVIHALVCRAHVCRQSIEVACVHASPPNYNQCF
jgi:hypothetical protein